MARPSLVPLVILFVVIVILAVVGLIVYSIVQDITKNTREKMEERNVMFTKDGMKVGVKEIDDEQYRDRSQKLVSRLSWLDRKRESEVNLFSVLVNMWNHTSFPAYKSRLWNMAGTTNEDQEAVEKRRP